MCSWGQRAPGRRCFAKSSFRNICPHLPLSNPVLLLEGGKNHFCSLCWLINFRFIVLSPCHAHTASYVIRLISHGSSRRGPEDPTRKRNLTAKSAAAFSGWRNCRLNEDPWLVWGHSVLWLTSRSALWTGEAVSPVPGPGSGHILSQPRSGNWENSLCSPIT